MENQIEQHEYLYFIYFLREFYGDHPDVLITLVAMASVFIRLSLHTFNANVADKDALNCIIGILFRKLCYINICISKELSICDPDIPVPISHNMGEVGYELMYSSNAYLSLVQKIYSCPVRNDLLGHIQTHTRYLTAHFTLHFISHSLGEVGYELMYSSNAYLSLVQKIYSCPVRNDLLRHIQTHTRYLTAYFKRLLNSVSVHELILLSLQASAMDKLLNQRFRYLMNYSYRQLEVIEFPIREPVYAIKSEKYKQYMSENNPSVTEGSHTLKTFISITKSVLRGKLYGKTLTTGQILKEIETASDVKKEDVIYSLFGKRSLYWPILKNLEVADFHTQWNSNHAEIRMLTFTDVTGPQDDNISILSDAMEE